MTATKIQMNTPTYNITPHSIDLAARIAEKVGEYSCNLRLWKINFMDKS
ncbi:MAG: hypothetical protein LBM67_03040 [Lentimicrobiaceae bacterium]|jgi:hypothetical protein|nr:hypothetical protein [Lentimicrobiaceae bacterium]